jgi:hypothetical protein
MTKPKPKSEPKTQYDLNTLKSFCCNNNVILDEKYNKIKITRDTKILGKCITSLCINNFNKTFRQLISTNGYCENCTKNNKKYILKLLAPTIKQNFIKTCLTRYNVTNVFKDEKIKNKIKESNLKNNGVEFPQQSMEIRKKTIETLNLNYNANNPQQSSEIRKKTQDTCILKYGVNSTILIPDIIKKRKDACFKKYGNEIPLKSELGKEKIRETCIRKYGIEYPMQNQEIAEKASKNSYRRKTYTFPSGNQITCQGYEPLALDKLIKEENIDENDVVTGCKNVPIIWYNDDNCKKHRHYVDIFIPSQNRCIEVKSTWTAKKNEDNIYLKQIAAKELGYEYEIWIYNAKKELVECYK